MFSTDPYAEAPQETVSSCVRIDSLFGLKMYFSSVAYLSEILMIKCKTNEALSLCWCLQNEEKSKTGRFGK